MVGLYPNIPHDEGLAAVRNALDERQEKTISTDSLVELAELVLKNNIFEFNSRVYKQKQGTAIGTKMAPPYAILFLDYLEKNFLDNSTFKPWLWWRYIDDIFLIWEHGEDELKNFINSLNDFHPNIKFTSDWSKESINFLDVQLKINGDKFQLIYMLSPLTLTNIYMLLRVTLFILKDPYHTVRHFGLTEFVLIIMLLITVVISWKIGSLKEATIAG